LIKGKPNIKFLIILNLLLLSIGLLTFVSNGTPDQDESTVLKPSVIVNDQPIIDNTVTITRVVSSGLGWIVIHADNGGSPGSTIGHAVVNHGVNTGVVVNISSTGQTPILYAMLHEDLANIGVYDGLPTEAAVRDDDGNVITPPFNVLDPDSPVVLVNNQQVVIDKVVVTMTHLDNAGWLVIHTQTSGYYGLEVGADIGHSFLPAGTNRDIVIEIDFDSKTDILYAKLYEDAGTTNEYDGTATELEVKDSNSFDVEVTFDTSVSEISTDDPTSTPTTGGISSSDLHILLSILSGLVLIGVGILNVSRNRTVRLNQIFFAFFVFIALYQIFDALMVYLGASSDNLVLNLVRDLSIASLVLGLGAGALSGMMIHYGEDIFFEQRNLLTGLAIVGILIFLGILGDSSNISGGGGLYGGSGTHAEISRDAIGWIGITGSFIVFSGILIYTLITLLPKIDSELRSRVIRLLLGFIFVIGLLFLFDIAFEFEFVSQGFMGDSIMHFLMHEVIVLGVLFVLSAFWTPLKEVKE
jgi:hypothetical protein